MTDSGLEGIVIRAAHPPQDPRERVWVAVSPVGALAVFVAILPSPGYPHALDRHLYVVEPARRRGLATRLVRHGRGALAAEDPPIVLQGSGIATPAGYRVAVRAGIEPSRRKREVLAEHGVEYDNYNQAVADEEGLAALHAAAARLGVPVAEPM